MSQYDYQKEIHCSYGEAVERARRALQEQGFGIITEIDAKATFKKKLDKDFDNYLILGACNPNWAFQVLNRNKEIGLLLPCNVLVYEQKGKVIVSALLPMKLISKLEDFSEMRDIAEQADGALRKAVDAV